jgi:hypothetical protein
MASLHSPATALYVAQIAVAIFLAILFLQSGIDKIVDWTGNLSWLTGHFAKSAVARLVPLLLLILTALEMGAGLLSAIGTVQLLVSRESTLAFYGTVVSTLAIVCLFFGQRMAKDYPGAAALVPYFIVSLFGLTLLGGSSSF